MCWSKCYANLPSSTVVENLERNLRIREVNNPCDTSIFGLLKSP